MRDGRSDVCSSGLSAAAAWLWLLLPSDGIVLWRWVPPLALLGLGAGLIIASLITIIIGAADDHEVGSGSGLLAAVQSISSAAGIAVLGGAFLARLGRSEEHTSELQSLMRISYAVFCLKKKTDTQMT